MLTSRSLAIACLLCTLAGCADKQPKPIMVSSAGLPSYAISYPERLNAEASLLTQDRQQASEQSQKLHARTTELKPGADPAMLLAIVKQADQAGRSEAFVLANAEARDLREFWAEERGPISARVNGAAQKHLTESKCGTCGEADLGGPISYAMGAGIDKQLEKRLRACNEAHLLIEYNKDRLGAQNVPAIQKLADDIALTSYQVNVALPQSRNRIDAMLGESDEVDETLVRAIEWERDFQASNPTAGEKKESQERQAVLEKSRAALPPAVSAAESARKDLDPQIEALRERYADEIERLEKDLEAQQARAAK
jgi:hypothetical protein